MDKKIIIGQKTLGLFFREQLSISEVGLFHHGIFIPWGEVCKVKITRFAWEGRRYWWTGYILKRVEWDKITIETVCWKVVLDSRVTIRPDDNIKYALGNFETETFRSNIYECITPAFIELRQLLERFCPNKITDKPAFSGSFDFSEWTSWVGAALVLLLILFLLAMICYALRPLFM